MRNLAGLVLLSLSGHAVAVGEPSASAELNPSRPGFTVITQESNLGPILKDNYAANPKWWLSGLHLVDLDCAGPLQPSRLVPGCSDWRGLDR